MEIKEREYICQECDLPWLLTTEEAEYGCPECGGILISVDNDEFEGE